MTITTVADNKSLANIPSEHEMAVFTTMAQQAVESKMYRDMGGQAGVMMIMLAARELGISPMQALNGGIHLIQGKVEISARMMGALIRRAGHSISVVESTDSICTLKGKRADNKDTAEVSYTLIEAQKAGLVKPSGGWAKCPKDMCFARALSRLARQLFSDVIGIGYVEGEIKETKEPPKVDIREIVVQNEETIEDLVQRYLANFEKCDRVIAVEYMQAIADHYQISEKEVLTRILKEETSKEGLQKKVHDWNKKKEK